MWIKCEGKDIDWQWIKKNHEPIICGSQENYFKFKDTNRLSKRIEEVILCK